jgi:hypothetical protein
MIKVEKERVLEILELNPAYLIGKEILLTGWGAGVRIIDVNLKCTHIKIEESGGMSIRWMNVDELEDKITFDNFGVSNNRIITIKTLNDMLEKL